MKKMVKVTFLRDHGNHKKGSTCDVSLSWFNNYGSRQGVVSEVKPGKETAGK